MSIKQTTWPFVSAGKDFSYVSDLPVMADLSSYCSVLNTKYTRTTGTTFLRPNALSTKFDELFQQLLKVTAVLIKKWMYDWFSKLQLLHHLRRIRSLFATFSADFSQAVIGEAGRKACKSLLVSWSHCFFYHLQNPSPASSLCRPSRGLRWPTPALHCLGLLPLPA